MVNEFLCDSLSNAGYFTFNSFVHIGNENYTKDYTLFKLILGVAHISVNYQRIHKVSIYESPHVLSGVYTRVNDMIGEARVKRLNSA